jgi:hypothetical protein
MMSDCAKDMKIESYVAIDEICSLHSDDYALSVKHNTVTAT